MTGAANESARANLDRRGRWLRLGAGVLLLPAVAGTFLWMVDRHVDRVARLALFVPLVVASLCLAQASAST